MLLRKMTGEEFFAYHAKSSKKYPPMIGEVQHGQLLLTVTASKNGIHFYLIGSNEGMTWAGFNCPYQIALMIAERVEPKHVDPKKLKKDFGIQYLKEEMDVEEEEDDENLIILP